MGIAVVPELLESDKAPSQADKDPIISMETESQFSTKLHRVGFSKNAERARLF